MQLSHFLVPFIIFNSFCESTWNTNCSSENEGLMFTKLAQTVKRADEVTFYDRLYNVDEYYQDLTECGKINNDCPCPLKTCDKKCCPKGKLITPVCAVFEYTTEDYEAANITNPENVTVHGYNCPIADANAQDGYGIYLHSNGSFYHRFNESDFIVKPEHFCIELCDIENARIMTAFICRIEDDSAFYITWYTTFFIAALPFNLVIFLVYMFIKELRTIHGICLAIYSICLFVAWLLTILRINHLLDNFCVSSAFAYFYSYLSSHFWMNSINIDTWLTFRRGKWCLEVTKKKKIIYLSIYAWGTPLICLMIFMFMQLLGPIYFPNAILPNIMLPNCWFPDNLSNRIYFDIVVHSLTIANLILFILTARNIWIAKKEIKTTLKSDSKRHYSGDKQRYLFYVKLVLAFGVNWSLTIIPRMLSVTIPFQYYFDFVNILHGLIIFIIAICNKNVFRSVKTKWQSLSTLSLSSTSSKKKTDN